MLTLPAVIFLWQCPDLRLVPSSTLSHARLPYVRTVTLNSHKWAQSSHYFDLIFSWTITACREQNTKTLDTRHWVLWLIRQHYFKAQASTSFEILVKLQQGFVWQKTRNSQNNFDKSMYQFKQIHVATMVNPCDESEKSMYQFWQICLTT